LNLNTSGAYNTAVGVGSLQANTTASTNTAVGYQSFYSNTTGADGTAVGKSALYSNITGAGNTALGAAAGYTTNNSYGTFIGVTAGYSSTGIINTFVGYGSGSIMTSGAKNTFLGTFNGNQLGLDLRTANNHVVLSDGDGNWRAYWTNTGVMINTPTAGGENAFICQNTSGTGYGMSIGVGNDSASYRYMEGYSLSASAQRIAIYTNGNVANTNNSYGSLSDIKLKQDIVDASSQWDDIKAIKVRKYRFKDTPDAPLQIGVVAQEIEQISAGLVIDHQDEIRDENGKVTGFSDTITKSVKYSVLYMKAIKALQEAMERIETLETRLTALESK
jgi:hypothetical protein